MNRSQLNILNHTILNICLQKNLQILLGDSSENSKQ